MPPTLDDRPWVLVRIAHQTYALPTDAVREMTVLPAVSRVPEAAPGVRGMLNLRGHVLSVVDLRARLGFTSALAELDALLATFDAREQDHRRWIDELEACIAGGRTFTLATDPLQCAFGKWYHALQTDNIVLGAQLRKIDAPHRRVHQRGAEAMAAVARGDIDGARAIARDIRERDLAATLALFEETKRELRSAHREIAIVIADGARTFAAAVDMVESVERLEHAEDGDRYARDPDEHHTVCRVARRPKDGSLVLVLDPAKVLAA